MSSPVGLLGFAILVFANLVAGCNPGAATNLRDIAPSATGADESRSTPSRAERPAFVSTARPPAKPSVRNGGHIYLQHCTECHGTQGDGKGPAAAALHPAPTNFRNKTYMDDQTLVYYYHALTQGVVGSAMGRWDAQLGEQERWDVAAYVWSLAVPPDNSKNGKPIYEEQCERCHGPDGAKVEQAKLGRMDLVGMSRGELLDRVRRAHPELAASLTNPTIPSRSDLVKAADYVWSMVYAPLVPVPLSVPTIPGLAGSLKLPEGEVCPAE